MYTMKKTEQSSPISVVETIDDTYLNFLIERINRFGSMPLQNLTGHLSQLPFNVRQSVGTSKSSLMSFLLRHPTLFEVDNKGIVHPISNKIKQSATRDRDSSCSSRGSECTPSLPQDIYKGKGKVYRIFPQYGFISAFEPIKSSVYFTALQFGDKNKTFLQDWNVYEGQLLYFNAKRGPLNCEAKYRATEVWLPDKKEQGSGDIELPYNLSSHKKRNIKFKPETGLYDPMECAGEGVIQNLFDKYGFISVKNDPRETIFFHIRNVVNYQNIIDLKDVLTKGDVVEYNAIRSTKKDSQVRWEATQVWIKSVQGASEDDDSGDEIFMSSPESSPPDSDNEISSGSKVLKITASNKLKAHESIFRNSTLICNKRESDAAKGTKNVEQNIISEISSDSICKNCFGKIYPRAENGTVIKFGENNRDIATVKSDIVYVYGTKVSDIMWEVEEGQGVYFDAQKTKTSLMWKATLVWIGAKPEIVQVKSNLETVETLDSADKATAKLKTNSGLDTEECLIDNEVESTNDGDSDTACSPCPVTSSSDASSENVIDWGDTPFPGEDSLKHEIQNEIPHCKETVKTPENADGNEEFGTPNSKRLVEKTVICKSEDISDAPEHQENATEYFASIKAEENLPIGNGICSQFIDDDKSNAFEEYVEEHIKIETYNEEPAKLQSTNEIDKISDMCNASAQQMSKVDIHDNMFGTVKVIYNAFAEITCKKLKKPITFFWKDLYLDGIRVQEKHSNLKEVLDIGDGVNFNCFEIVDDANHSWQKVTLVWKGKKPRSVIEQKPEEFIKQHKLVVSFKISISEVDDIHNENSGENGNIILSSTDDINIRSVQSVTESLGSSNDSLIDSTSQLESLNNSSTFSTSDTAIKKITLSDVSLPKNPSVVSSILTSDVEKGDMQLSVSESQMPPLLPVSAKGVSQVLNSQLCKKFQEGNFSNLQLSEDNVTTLCSVIVKSLLSQLNVPCLSRSCACTRPSAMASACQTGDTLESESVVCVQPQQSLSDNKTECTRTVSTGVQTLITGNIISVEIFPQ